MGKTAQELSLNKFLFEDEALKKQENAPSKREELLDKLTTEVFNTKNIQVRTDLNTKQITSLSKGLLFAEKFESNVLLKFCNNIMELSLSKDRKSRGEFGDMAKSSISRADNEIGIGGGLNGRLWGE